MTLLDFIHLYLIRFLFVQKVGGQKVHFVPQAKSLPLMADNFRPKEQILAIGCVFFIVFGLVAWFNKMVIKMWYLDGEGGNKDQLAAFSHSFWEHVVLGPPLN